MSQQPPSQSPLPTEAMGLPIYDDDDFLDDPFVPSTESESQSAALSTKKRPRSSSVWQYSRPAKDKEPERQGQRKRPVWYCGIGKCEYSSIITSNVTGHLQTKHNVKVQSQEHAIRRHAGESVLDIMKKSILR